MANWAAAFRGLGEGMDDLSRAKEKTLDMEYRNMRDANLRRWQLDDDARDRKRDLDDHTRDLGEELDKEGRAEADRIAAEERRETRDLDAESRAEADKVAGERRKEKREDAVRDLTTPEGVLREAEKERDARRLILIADARRSTYGNKAPLSESAFVDRELNKENKFMEELIREPEQLDAFKKTQPERITALRELYRDIYGGNMKDPAELFLGEDE